MSKKKMFVMCGEAGSGKSTWIQNNLHTFEGYTTVVSRDMIRFLLVHEGEDYFSRETLKYMLNLLMISGFVLKMRIMLL